MGDDLSTDAKLELMWRDYEQRQKQPPGGPSMAGVDRMLVWILLAANAIGMGPEAIATLMKAWTK